jgi:hypothetical protein
MSITIRPELETRLRARAEAEGLTIEAYVERLVRADQQAEDELGALAIEGLNSGEPIEPHPGFWEEKHRRLDEKIKKTAVCADC